MGEPDPVVEDRRRALAPMDAAGRAEVVARVPLLAAAVAGRGPAAHVLAGRRAAAGGLDGLARLLGSAVGISVSLTSCSPLAQHVAQVLAWHDAAVTPELLAAEALEADPAAVAGAVGELVGCLLAVEDGDGLRLRPGVAGFVPLPGLAVRDLAGDPSVTSSVLDRWLAALGVRVAHRDRRSRLQALAATLGDPDAVTAAVAAVSPAARDVFARLAARLEGLPVEELGCPWWMGGLPGRLPGDRWGRPRTPVHELVEAGLAWVEVDRQHVQVLLDAAVAVTGRVHRSWPEPPRTDASPLRAAAGLPPAPGRVQALLDLWATRPADGLKSGGLGARTLSAAARQLGIPEADGRVLGTVARQLGLVEPVVRIEGTGRRAEARTQYVPSERAGGFAAAPFPARWAALVEAWLDDEPTLPEVSLVRRTLVADLAALAPGTGVPEAELPAWAATRRVAHGVRPGLVTEAVSGLRALGLVPADGPVGLTDDARTVLTDPGALPVGEAGRLIVQADHTVVVPPDADPDVLARLERLAVPVSSGAARVYRLDPGRIGAAVADGTSAGEVLAFLEGVADTPVPGTVERLVADAARAAEGLRALAAGTVLVAADPAALARALGVKAAGLTAVAPTVAVSDLPMAKVTAALRAKGVHLEGAGCRGPLARPASPARPLPGRPLTADGPLQPDAATLTRLLAPAP